MRPNIPRLSHCRQIHFQPTARLTTVAGRYPGALSGSLRKGECSIADHGLKAVREGHAEERRADDLAAATADRAFYLRPVRVRPHV